MVIFGDDLIYGNMFRASDFALVPCSFDGAADGDEDTSLAPNTNSEFLGGNPSSLYLSQNYANNLELSLSLIKNPCIFTDDDAYLTEQELRAINRVVEGQRGFQWLKIVSDGSDNKETDIWYYCRTTKVSYQKFGGRTIGINITFECNGSRAFSEEQIITINATAETPFYIYNNTDDLWQYVYPVVTIESSNNGTLTIINHSDNDRESELQNLSDDEIIIMDSKRKLLTTNKHTHTVLLNDFNLNWIRLAPGRNVFESDHNIKITFKFRAARKVAVV